MLNLERRLREVWIDGRRAAGLLRLRSSWSPAARRKAKDNRARNRRVRHGKHEDHSS
jgi:hypothetical protein